MSHDDADRVEGGGPATGTEVWRGDASVTATGLFRGGLAALRRNPSVVLAWVVAGLAVAVVDWVRVADPVPVVEFVGLAGGRLTIHYGVMVTVIAGTSTPLAALAGLRPTWLAWLAGLELVRNGALVLAGVYGFAKLLDVSPTPAATLRYAAVFGAFAGLRVLAPEISTNLLVGVAFIALFLLVLARLLALPGLVVAGASVSAAAARSWRLAAGRGWPLVRVVVVLGLAAYLLASLPVAGPVAASLVAAVQTGVVAAFIRRVESDRSRTRDRADRLSGDLRTDRR